MVDSTRASRFAIRGSAAGGWRLAAGGWRLAAGGWRLARKIDRTQSALFP
jgi:hypothetical protein